MHNCCRDAVATVLIDTGTSLLCGTIVFIALGSIAFSDGEEIGNLFAQGDNFQETSAYLQFITLKYSHVTYFLCITSPARS